MEDSLFSLYFSYKQATNIVLDWLDLTIGLEQFRDSRLTTTDIVGAAQLVRERELAVPEYVLSKFREALVKRRAVHRRYVERCCLGDDEENLRHKHFIDRLEQTYQTLLPLASLPHLPSVPTNEQNTHVPLTQTPNRYACLADMELPDDPDNFDEGIPRRDTSAASRSLGERTEKVLEDDEIGEYIELSLFELDAICGKLNEYWTDVASGKLSIVVAGFLSNTAYHAVERIVRSSPGLMDTKMVIQKWYFTKNNFRIRFTDIPELQQGYQRFSTEFGLWQYCQILTHCRTLDEYKEIVPGAGELQHPKDFIHNHADNKDSFSLDDIAMDKIQESMRQLLISGRAISALEERPMMAEHLLPALDKALQDQNSPIPTYLVFGMEMLLSTYKAFLWSNEHMNEAHCRLTALKFANNVIKSIEDCMPCLSQLCWCQNQNHCTCPFNEFICNFQCKLRDYVREKRFDLYYQAPWVASGHIIEILQSSMYEGVYLCCASNYVAAVLHLYNALRQVNPQMQQIPWLDQMCGIFKKSLFPGSIPNANFSSCFRRSGGGNLLKTSDSHARNRFKFSRGNSFISNRPAACHRLSLFYSQHMMDYELAEDILMQISEGRQIDHPTPSQIKSALQKVNSKPFPVTMDKIKDAVLPELQGDQPIARVDFFTIFRVCIQILEELCTHMEENTKASAQNGFEWVDYLLEQISEHQKDDHVAPLLPFFSPLKRAMLPFASLDKDKILSEFAWNI
ncbi:hypothetical protein BJX99DRAFT_256561 [Aspergillus californicus]